MARPAGGWISGYTAPTAVSARGVWSLRDVYPSLVSSSFPNEKVDLFRSSVTLLLHCNGSNGSTTFTDSSPTPATITANGSAQISTAASKFGGASLAISGNPDSLSLSAGTRFTFSGDFTIEAWYYINSLPAAYAALIEARSGAVGAQWVVGIRNSSGTAKTEIYLGSSGTLNSASSFPIGSWAHLAIVRSGSTISTFINGVKDANTLTFSGSVTPSGSTIYLGRLPYDNLSWSGYLDEICITKAARYTASFTPRTSQIPDV